MFVGDVGVDLVYAAIKRHNDIYRVTVREKDFYGYPLRVGLSAKDYFHLGLDIMFRRNAFINFTIVLCFVLWLLFLPSDRSTSWLFWGMALAVFLYVTVLALCVAASWKRIVQKYSLLGYADNGLFIRDKDGLLRLPWRNVLVRETRQYYFLYYSRFRGFILPKAELDFSSAARMDEYIKIFGLKKKHFRRSGN